MDDWGWGDFPLAEFIAGMTFIAFFILEELIHLEFMDIDEHEAAEGLKGGVIEHEHGHDHHHYHNEKTNLLIKDSTDEDSHSHHNHDHHDEHDDHHPIPTIPPRSNIVSRRRSSTTSICNHNTHRRSSIDESFCEGSVSSHSVRNHHPHQLQFLSILQAPNNDDEEDGHSHVHEHHHHDNHIEQHLHGSLLASIILLLALSIHSILEGLAIGITQNEDVILTTVIAILAHKCFASYSLGSSLIASEINNAKFQFYILIGVFAICTPLGIFFGYIITSETNTTMTKQPITTSTATSIATTTTTTTEYDGNDNDISSDNDSISNSNALITGIIQAMVSGTFLYIAIVEVAIKELMNCRQGSESHCEKSKERHRLIAFVFGYIIMSALAIFV